jgi:hypothetical protein
MVAACSPAKAHDFARDLQCSVTGSDGSPLAWWFTTNTSNMDGSTGGTMIETAAHSGVGASAALWRKRRNITKGQKAMAYSTRWRLVILFPPWLPATC